MKTDYINIHEARKMAEYLSDKTDEIDKLYNKDFLDFAKGTRNNVSSDYIVYFQLIDSCNQKFKLIIEKLERLADILKNRVTTDYNESKDYINYVFKNELDSKLNDIFNNIKEN